MLARGGRDVRPSCVRLGGVATSDWRWDVCVATADAEPSVATSTEHAGGWNGNAVLYRVVCVCVCVFFSYYFCFVAPASYEVTAVTVGRPDFCGAGRDGVSTKIVFNFWIVFFLNNLLNTSTY